MLRWIIFTLALATAMPARAAEYKADFSKALDKGWSFVREDKADWRLKDGNIELLAQPTNIWGKRNNKTQNFLLRALPGATATVEVTVDFNPRKEYEQAGLMIYLDDDNYIKFDRELYKGQSCTLVLERKAKPKVVKKIPFREGPLRLRLEIADGKVKAMVKAPDSKEWTAHGETKLPGSTDKVKVGLFALQGDTKAPRWATFSDFTLRALASGAWAADGSRNGSLKGTVSDPQGRPIRGAMVTAFDAKDRKSISVFTNEEGHFRLSGLAPRDHMLRSRLLGYQDEHVKFRATHGAAKNINVTMKSVEGARLQVQRRAFERINLLPWPDEKKRLNFVMRCGYCHQLGTEGFRALQKHVNLASWKATVEQLMGSPRGQYAFQRLHKETQRTLAKKLFETFKPGAENNWPTYTPPPAPSGEALKAVITEWSIGVRDFATIHDIEPGDDGLVYAVDMGHDCVRTLDPATGDRQTYRIPGGKVPGAYKPPILGPHSIEQAPDGTLWITLSIAGKMAKFDPKTKEFTVIQSGANGRRGRYPHTLRFDQNGICWYTDAGTNSVFRLDPKTLKIKEYRLLSPRQAVNVRAAGEAGGITPYGIDIAPDGKVWFGKLNGQRIGVIDPTTGKITEWKPPVHGPRRLHVAADGVVWIPGFASGNFCTYNPKTGKWKVYDLPGDGHETPYALNIHPDTGEVWICGTSSDTIMRFRPKTQALTVYRLPSQVTYTREIEFDKAGNVWTCNSNGPTRHTEGHHGTIIRIEIPK